MLGIFLAPVSAEFPRFHLVVMRIMSWAPWVLAAGCVLLIPAFLKFLNDVKNGAPIFRQTGKRYEPWPAHSNPAARRAGWGGLDTENDVRGRQTRARITGESSAVQSIVVSRAVSTCLFLLTGIFLLAAYPVTQSLVYEVTPPHIEALKKMTYMTWPLLVFWGFLISVFGIYCTAVPVKLVEFDKANDQVRLKTQRFFGLLNILFRPTVETLPISEIAGLQLISYPSQSLRRNNLRLEQYELNLVFNDGIRRTVTKQSRHKTTIKDAMKLARFLQVPVWDRSGYYHSDNPEILHPSDPLLQPL